MTVYCPGDDYGPCPDGARWERRRVRGHPRERCVACNRRRKNGAQRQLYALRKDVTGYGEPRRAKGA